MRLSLALLALDTDDKWRSVGILVWWWPVVGIVWGDELLFGCLLHRGILAKWNVRCLLCSIVQKGTHKWNIKRHYDTVLCSMSAADAANLSIFTIRHVHCRLRCSTSSWGHIEYMIADAWLTRNKWFIGCGTGGKLTLWTPLLEIMRQWTKNVKCDVWKISPSVFWDT